MIVLHEKLRFYNNKIILVLKFVFIHSLQEVSLTYPFLTQSTVFLETLFFQPLSSNRIKKILTFAIQGVSLFLRNTSCS